MELRGPNRLISNILNAVGPAHGMVAAQNPTEAQTSFKDMTKILEDQLTNAQGNLDSAAKPRCNDSATSHELPCRRINRPTAPKKPRRRPRDPIARVSIDMAVERDQLRREGTATGDRSVIDEKWRAETATDGALRRIGSAVSMRQSCRMRSRS